MAKCTGRTSAGKREARLQVLVLLHLLGLIVRLCLYPRPFVLLMQLYRWTETNYIVLRLLKVLQGSYEQRLPLVECSASGLEE